MLKRFLAALLLLAVLSGAFFLTTKYYFVRSADAQVSAILAKAKNNDQVQTADAAARHLYEIFSKRGYVEHPYLARLRPYLSNRSMPGIFRIPPGALELNTLEGWCDDAARALIYVLAKEGIHAEQWNMQGPHAAHAAVKATFDNGTAVLFDPFYGYSSIAHGAAQDPIVVRDAMRNGAKADTLLTPFDAQSNMKFYSEFGTLFMGAQDEPLTITANIPSLSTPLILGTVDNNSRDVYGALMKNDMTMTWHYAGHKYDRGWTRELVAPQDMQVEIILNRTPNDGILRTFTPPPTVDGTKLRWDLLTGEKIVSKDAKAAISPAHLSSYIEVDQIVMTPKETTP